MEFRGKQHFKDREPKPMGTSETLGRGKKGHV
jgi:hypothetical protein